MALDSRVTPIILLEPFLSDLSLHYYRHGLFLLFALFTVFTFPLLYFSLFNYQSHRIVTIVHPSKQQQ